MDLVVSADHRIKLKESSPPPKWKNTWTFLEDRIKTVKHHSNSDNKQSQSPHTHPTPKKQEKIGRTEYLWKD